MSSSAIFGAPKACPIFENTPKSNRNFTVAKLAVKYGSRNLEKAKLPLIVIRAPGPFLAKAAGDLPSYV
jgi:hypothetical protein